MMMRTRQSMWPSVTPWNRRASSPRSPPSHIPRSSRPSPYGLGRLVAGSRPSSWPSSSFGGVARDSIRKAVGMTDTLEKPLGAARSHPGQPASPRELIVLVTMGLAVVVAPAALAFVGAVVFAMTFPGAAHADGLFDFGVSFLGSASVTSANGPLTQTWGPGWAWSGLLSVGVLFLVASLTALRLPTRRPLSEPAC